MAEAAHSPRSGAGADCRVGKESREALRIRSNLIPTMLPAGFRQSFLRMPISRQRFRAPLVPTAVFTAGICCVSIYRSDGDCTANKDADMFANFADAIGRSHHRLLLDTKRLPHAQLPGILVRQDWTVRRRLSSTTNFGGTGVLSAVGSRPSGPDPRAGPAAEGSNKYFLRPAVRPREPTTARL